MGKNRLNFRTLKRRPVTAFIPRWRCRSNSLYFVWLTYTRPLQSLRVLGLPPCGFDFRLMDRTLRHQIRDWKKTIMEVLSVKSGGIMEGLKVSECSQELCQQWTAKSVPIAIIFWHGYCLKLRKIASKAISVPIFFMVWESIESRTTNKKVSWTLVFKKRSCLVKLLTAFKSIVDKFETVEISRFWNEYCWGFGKIWNSWEGFLRVWSYC